MPPSRATRATAAMTAKCANHERCGSQAKGPRARYCAQCFRDNAARKGSLSSGNSKGKGSPGNAGNVQKGSVKKRAGERSGVRRSAKSALVVKKRWLDKILAGRKTWEIRGGPTTKRGWIHFAQSGSTGKLMGRARLVNCFSISPTTHFTHDAQAAPQTPLRARLDPRHRMPRLNMSTSRVL